MTIYVDWLHGKDSNTGNTIFTAVKSLSVGVDITRKKKAGANTIKLAPGYHFLAETVQLTAEDKGYALFLSFTPVTINLCS